MKKPDLAQSSPAEGCAPPKTVRIANPELQAMAKLDAIMATLPEESLTRVLMWLVGVYMEPSAKKTALFNAVMDLPAVTE